MRHVVFGTLVLLVLAIGCGEIAGLGPSASALGMACGITVTGGSCAQCLADRCCGVAQACSATPSCAAYADCAMPCGGDYACRARCFQEHPTVSAPVADLDQCMATHCSAACGTPCGLTEAYAMPDAAPGCYECLSSFACSASQSCFDDPACTELARCTAIQPTIDEIFACANDAGADAAAAFTGFIFAGRAHCSQACNIGGNWDCVGHVGAPSAVNPTQMAYAVTDDVTGAQVGATVRACGPGDQACARVVAEGVTDDAGVAHFSVPAANLFGFAGYFEVSEPPDHEPLLQFFEFPLSVNALTLSSPLLTRSELANAYAAVGLAPPDPSHGDLVIDAMDCAWTPAPGVHIDLAITDSTTRIVYGASTSATSTGFEGDVEIYNVPAGPNRIRMTVPGHGVVADDVAIVVRGQTRSALWVHPR